MLGTHECDDGNTIDGDGCSSDCKIEPCWECDRLSPSNCNIDPALSIGITDSTFAADNSNVAINFNNSIVL